MLVQPIESVLHENVLPWIFDRMVEFMYEDDFINVNTEDIVRDAFVMSRDLHAQSVEAEY
jgi:hypothetical protein